MKLCLIIPPSSFLLDERVFPFLGVLKVAASLEKSGHDVDVLDLSGVTNYEAVVSAYAITHPQVLKYGITATSPQMPAAIRIAAKIPAWKMLGGPHATLTHAAARSEAKRGHFGRARRDLAALRDTFDVIVAGDGELAVHRALQMGKGVVDADDPGNELFLSHQGFSDSPWPAREKIDLHSYHYAIDGERASSLISQLGCPFACGFCVSGSTRIYGPKGWQSISDVLKTLNPHTVTCEHGHEFRQWSFQAPIGVFGGIGTASCITETGYKPTRTITAKNGLRITGTPDHRVLIANNEDLAWKRLGDLCVGDWMALSSPPSGHDYVPLAKPTHFRDVPPGGFERRECTYPSVLTPDLAWLIGFIIGDGCLPVSPRHERVHFCVTDDIEEKLRRILMDSFGLGLTVSRHCLTDKMTNGWVYSVSFFEFLVQSIGMDPRNKHCVPQLIFSSPQDVIDEFLRGLWDADGYTDPKRPDRSYLTTASEPLSQDVALLILQCGRLPNIQRIKQQSHLPGSAGVCFRVSAMVPRIPMGRNVYRSGKSGLWFWRTKRSKNRQAVKKSTLIESGLPHSLLSDNLFFIPVASIEDNELLEPVYDLTVPFDENFIANGFVAHNCAGRNSAMLRRIRLRPPDNVVQEIIGMHERYDYKGFFFLDDELNVNRSMLDLMRQLREQAEWRGIEWKLRGFLKAELFTEDQAEAMHAAGFRQILIGFEGGHPRILDNIQKRATVEDNTRAVAIAHKHGLKVKALMSIGHPGESEETVLAVRDWLLQVKPSDFDVTVITPYPGSPYYDSAEEIGSGVFCFTTKNGDRLFMDDVDFTREAHYYKGAPGEYVSHVWTPDLTKQRLVALRDEVENEVRTKLGIPFYPTGTAIQYEHSFGGGIPGHILKS